MPIFRELPEPLPIPEGYTTVLQELSKHVDPELIVAYEAEDPHDIITPFVLSWDEYLGNFSTLENTVTVWTPTRVWLFAASQASFYDAPRNPGQGD